ncbi:hypothetical protein V8D89_008056 [Ganoderma adspersum]
MCEPPTILRGQRTSRSVTPMKGILPLLSVFALAVSSTVLWDGRFSNYTDAADFNQWSWSNQVGTYQTYIYLSAMVLFDPVGETASSWLTPGSEYEKPATTGEKQGVKVKINAESTWNGGPMLRTELLPQTTNVLSGHLFFHVSLQIPMVNPPDPAYEHQIVFWEGHYADIKYGQLSGQNGIADTLKVITGGKSIWSVQPVKGTWRTRSPGGLWVSTSSNALEKVYDGSLNGNGGTDWHIDLSSGALRLPLNGRSTQQINETDLYYSGIYVEDSGPITQP